MNSRRTAISSPLEGEGWEGVCVSSKDTPLPTALCTVGVPLKGGGNKESAAP